MKTRNLRTKKFYNIGSRTLWSKHEIFALTCQGDLNNDSTVDCVAGGRAGVKYIENTMSVYLSVGLTSLLVCLSICLSA
jgi:hypothetical protein